MIYKRALSHRSVRLYFFIHIYGQNGNFRNLMGKLRIPPLQNNYP
jgi:hypothetical protein